MAKKSKLLAALDAHKGRNFYLEKQKKLQKAAEKRKKERGENSEEESEAEAEDQDQDVKDKVCFSLFFRSAESSMRSNANAIFVSED